MVGMITKTTLLSIAGILIALGVATLSTGGIQQFGQGVVEIFLGVVLITIREYFKTIPENDTDIKKS